MASHEENDHLPEETKGYKLSQPKQSLAEYDKMGSGLGFPGPGRTMPEHQQPQGAAFFGPAHLLPRYPVRSPNGWDATPSHRRQLVRHQSHQSAATPTSQEDNQVGHGGLPSWLPQETLSLEDRVNAWLSDQEASTRIVNSTNSVPRASPTINYTSASPAPPGPYPPHPSRSPRSALSPSGHPPVVKKAKSFANLLHRVASKPVLRIPRRLRRTSRSSSSNSSLDSKITCRGLPNMMIKKETLITSHRKQSSDPADELADAADKMVIGHFRDSWAVTPDESVKVTKFKADENDESLQRYKKSLGLGGGKDISDPNDPRVCIIQSLTMESAGRPPVTIDLSQPGSENTLKDNPFKIKEGAKFTMVASFRVQHEILSGLHYVQTVKRKGIRVSKDSEMLGSYAPNTDNQPVYTKRFQEEEAPSGMIARGHYNAVSTFVDDDKKTHLQFEWSFDISKDW